MQHSGQVKYEMSTVGEALRQGEILSDVVQICLYPESLKSNSLSFHRSERDFAIVVTPDCDLDWDFKAQNGRESQGKLIPNILLCTVIFASDLAKRINDDRPLSKTFLGKTAWTRTRQNKEERYHYLEKIDSSLDLQDKGIRPLGIDFKDFFTLPTDLLYSSIKNGSVLRRCRLVRPYNDHLNSRFAYFQSRIALPEVHQHDLGEILTDGERACALTE